MSKKNLVSNVDAIDGNFIEEFVMTPDGLPILLMNILDEVYEKRVDDFFKYIDKNNSERVIDAILEFDEHFYY